MFYSMPAHGTRPFRMAAMLIALAVLATLMPALLAPLSPLAVRAAELCDQYASTSVTDANGQFIIMNNRWGASTTQCINVPSTGSTGWSVSQSSHNLAVNGPPAGYPAIYKGCHYGACTSGWTMRQESAITSARTSWSMSVPSSGAWNNVYDIWFDPTARTTGQNLGAEMMIWLRYQGGIGPAGTKVATVSINGASWDVWYKADFGPAGGTWRYIAYVRTSPTSSVNFDLKPFFTDSKNRGYISSSWYLTSVQAGSELWQGGAGNTTSSFCVAVNNASACGGGGSPTATPTSGTTVLYDFEGSIQSWTGTSVTGGPWSVAEAAMSGSTGLKADVALGATTSYLRRTATHNLSGKTQLKARVKHASWGSMGSGMTAKIFIKTGSTYQWYDSGAVAINSSTATVLTLNLSGLANLGDVREVGVQFIAPSNSSGSSAVYVDYVTVQ